MFRAIIFDLDGVITDTARYHYLAWKRLAEGLGVPFDEAFNEGLKGVDRMGSLDLILRRGGLDPDAAERQRLADQKNDDYRQLVATMTRADVLPGALEALEAARRLGLKVGLASVSKNAGTILERLEITGFFDVVADANLIRRGKPDPEIFLTVAEQMGIAPADCIGVEDAAVGVQAIKAAGMVAIGVGDPVILAQADRVVPSLVGFDLAALLKA
jgi:beta-phosphoglucomutase